MRLAFRCAIYLLFWLLASSAGAVGPTLFVDVLFPEGAEAISRVEMDKLAQMICVLQNRDLEVTIIVGHADALEKDPDALAQRRTREVQNALVGMGIDSAKTYIESKGSAQPVSADSNQRAANRRVNVEAVNIPIDYARPISDCEILWKRQLLALDADRAGVVARSLVRDGGLKVTEPFLEAIQNIRLDLLIAFLRPDSGLTLNAKDRKMLIEAAARTGKPDMIRAFIDTKPQFEDWSSMTKALSEVTCSSASEAEKLESARMLLNFGVSPNDESEYPPLACTAERNNMALLELLLSAGADSNRPKGLVVYVGRHREIVFRLLQAGANPLAKSSRITWEGRTLFHTTRLETPADVEWLLNLGLDINAKDKAGFTPLDTAVGYASEAVLEAMAQAGAKMDEKLDGYLLSEALRNPKALVWLIRRGLPLGNHGNLLSEVAAKGEPMLPALSALIERRINLNQRSGWNETALAAAIRNYHPAVVRALLAAGANPSDVRQGMSAIQLAQSLSAKTPQAICLDCFRPEANKKETLSPQLLRLKSEILEILSAK